MTAEPPTSNLQPSTLPLELRLREVEWAALARPRYRGTLIDNVATAPMGKGHGNRGQPFDIESACYLKPLVAAFHHPRVRKIIVKAAVKTLKSFFAEMAAAHHICYGSGDVGIFFGSGEVADDVSTTRILSYFESIPSYAEKLRSVATRFDNTKDTVKFPDKTLFIKPANLANAQQKNLEMFVVQDAFVTGTSGMIDQMIERTTQYPDTKKIIIESQGGEAGDDFERHWLDTDQRELHVLCPCCGQPHIFNWKAFDPEWMTRTDEFTATPPKHIPSLDHAAWVEYHRPLLLKPENRVAGFKRGADELIKAGDEYVESAILRETHFECFHCGGLWRDDGEFGETRMALDRSSHYVASRKDALPENVGFNFPQWINRRLPWGRIMLEKLKRQRVAQQLGNYEPLRQWWQKYAGRAWDSDITAKAPERISASIYDLAVKIPGELCRVSSTDIQMNATHMIYQAWAIGDGTPPRLLHYEWVKPPAAGWADHEAREFCKRRVREMDKEFGIEPQNSMKDCAHRPDLVREWAAEDAVFAKIRAGGRVTNKWVHYGLLIGDDRTSYKWAHPGRKPTWERFKQKETVFVDCIKEGRRQRIPIQHRLWSNPSIKQIAARWRDGDGAPKIQVHAKFLQDTSKEGFSEQMKSERLLPWKGRPGKMRWDNEGRPNHAWDGWCMVQVRMDELGLLNHFGAAEADTEADG